jgi:ribokinase
MGHLLVVGSYNATLTVFSHELPLRGQTVLGDRLDIGPGGKGNNQAIAARRLGADVTFAVKIGRDYFGTEARELLAREELPGGAVLEGRLGTGVALIMVDDEGDNIISVAPGANSELTMNDVLGLSASIDEATHVLCQLECTTQLFRDVARWARGRGLTVVLNPAPAAPLDDESYDLVDILTPNETELYALSGAEIAPSSEVSEEVIVAAARLLLDRGVREMVVTLGARGALHVHTDGFSRFEPYQVRAVDTTGAGDAFNGGLLAGLVAGLPMDSAIDLGMRAGAFCVTRAGVIDGLATREELDREIPAHLTRRA